jgi:DNA-directed RNA polymerase subunit delta
MCDVAYEILMAKPGEQSFLDLWNGVVDAMKFSESQAENKIAQFYSALMLDVRFAPLEGNRWDLRTRRLTHETVMDATHLLEEEFNNNDDDEEYIVNEDEIDFERLEKPEEEE